MGGESEPRIDEDRLARLKRLIQEVVVYRGQKSPGGPKHGTVSPHKPLTLLMYIRHVLDGGNRLIRFDQIEHALGAVLVRFGGADSGHPEYPFVRLAQTPRLWEVRFEGDERPSTDSEYTAAHLRRVSAEAGLLDEWYRAVRQPEFAAATARFILWHWFDDPQRRFEMATATKLDDLIFL